MILLVDWTDPADYGATQRTEEQIAKDYEEAHKGEMGERLEAVGARVGALTCSLMWHNLNDLDLHCESPTGAHIFYANRKGNCEYSYPVSPPPCTRSTIFPADHTSVFSGTNNWLCEQGTGLLDVDMNAKKRRSTNKPIENILWHNPPKGHYRFCEPPP